MERFEHDTADHHVAFGIPAEEATEFLDTEFQDHEDLDLHEHAEGSAWTDDPVRVYLREMGAVRLLSRQGEIDLARRMERGRNRLRKAFSRSPLVWQRVLALQEELRNPDARPAEFFEVGGVDDE